MVYLCHKCAGHLTASGQYLTASAMALSAYACRCSAGYIRAGQTPTHSEDVRYIQRRHMQARLKLYASQGRPENDQHVQWARDMLAKLGDDSTAWLNAMPELS